MTMRLTNHILCINGIATILLAVNLTMGADRAAAQDTSSKPDCVRLTEAYRNANPNTWPTGAEGRISACGIDGARAAAAAMRRNRTVRISDALTAQHVAVAALAFRGNEIFSAAKEVALDRNASPLARVYSLLILTHYFRENAIYDNLPIELAKGATCTGLGYASSHVKPIRISSAPADSLDQIVAVADIIRHDKTAPTGLRSMANCLQYKMNIALPLSHPEDILHVQYRCDSVFTITNTADKFISPRFAATRFGGTGEMKPFTLNPHSVGHVKAHGGDALWVYYNGQLIARTIPNNASCTPVDSNPTRKRP
jgi:hypothetical protein